MLGAKNINYFSDFIALSVYLMKDDLATKIE
jgi:hypothetical protein